MKEEELNPKAVITDRVMDSLAALQRFTPDGFRQDVDELTDLLLEEMDSSFPEDMKRKVLLLQEFRAYVPLIEGLHPQDR